MQAITLDHISKSYPGSAAPALQPVSLSIPAGQLFGLIGPDGAGKTTLFRILATLLLPDTGQGQIFGKDLVRDYTAIRHMTGYMPGKFALYPDLSVEENLRFFATVFNTRVATNIDFIRDIYGQIEPFRKRKAGQLSGGMKQKLALSCALIHRPRVLILDEPTTGVDAVSRKEFWDMLGHFRDNGVTILVSTPYMDEAALCDQVGLIQKGNIFDINTPEAIIQGFGQQLWAVKSADMYRLLKDLRSFPETESCYAFGDYHHLTLRSDDEGVMSNIRARLEALQHQDIVVQAIAPNIEDCFMAMMDV